MKAILEIDMPKSCSTCQFVLDDKQAHYYCFITRKYVESYDYKSKRCPLIPISESEIEYIEELLGE